MTAGADDRRHLARATALQTVLVGVSRATGFARVVVVAAVLGTTFLGNTYQSANTVPNIVFELFAAGALQAVLVPALVARFDEADDEGAQRLAGSVLGHTLALLGGLAVVGAVAAPLVMEALVSGVDDPGVRADQVSLGTVFLLIFLPQVLVYDVGLVATAVLHARGRFALPAIAPAVNNVVVCAAYGLFWWLRRDEGGPSLDLDAVEVAVLAGGTTLGVVAFCALPIAGAHRGGFRFRPNLDRSDPALRSLARQGGWAAAFLAMTQVLLAAVLVLGNAVEGGIVGYQVAFTFFLLPHALFAVPILTTLYPAAARQARAGGWDDLRTTVRRGTTSICLFVLPAAVALATLAGPLSRLVLFGNVDRAGRDVVADAVVAFAPGLVGYGLFYFFTRVLYAWGDSRTPALVHAVVVAGGVAAMAAASAAIDGRERIAALAWAHSATYLVGAAALGTVLGRRLAAHGAPLAATGTLAPQVAAGLASLGAAAGVAALAGGDGRVAAAVSVVAGGTVAYGTHLLVQAALGGPRPRAIVALLRPGGAG